MKRIACLILTVFCLSVLACGCTPEKQPEMQEPPAFSLFPCVEETKMAPGQHTSFTAVFEAGENQSGIVWSSSDESVAAVDSVGNVTAIAEGSAMICAAVESQPEFFVETKVTVLPNVSSIELLEDEITILTGSADLTYLPKCKIIPENAYYQGVRWISSDDSIASVAADGSIFAVAPGRCTITGRSEDPACTAELTCTVTVKTGIEEILLQNSSETGYVGKTMHLKAAVFPAKADKSQIEWVSSDETIATVDTHGTVKFLEAGNVTITCCATDGSGVSAQIEIETVKGTNALKVDRKEVKLLLGSDDSLAGAQLVCTLMPEDTSFTNVTWASDNEAIATVDENGFVRAVSEGKCTITVTSKDPGANGKVKDSAVITVGRAITGIRLSDPGATLAKGNRYKLTATLSPANPLISKLIWESDNEAVLRVDSHGNLQAISAGTATIRCSASDGSGVSAVKTFRVIQWIEKLQSPVKRLVVTAGKTAQCNVTVLPESADIQKLRYESGNPAVATVNASGEVSGISTGECTISVRSTDGSKKTLQIPVIVEPAVPLSVTNLGRNGYNGYYSEFTASFRNLTKTKTITAITFTLAYQAGDDAGQADFTAENLHLAPGRTQKLGSWKASGLNFVDSFTISLKKVVYEDGTSEVFDHIPIGQFFD